MLSALASIIFSSYAFAVDQESLETLRKISKLSKAEQKKLFDKVEQLEEGTALEQAVQMRTYLMGLGVTADTFSNDKIKIEDFYKNKIIYEGGFLGDRKFEIPKAYISSYSHIIPDKETLSENSSISFLYIGPDKRAKVEKSFTDNNFTELMDSGRYIYLSLRGEKEDPDSITDFFQKDTIPSPEDNIFGLVAYKFKKKLSDDLQKKSIQIIYGEYQSNKVKSRIHCFSEFINEESKKQCESDLIKGDGSVCDSKKIKGRSPECIHIFGDHNISYALTFPFSEFKNWKQNRIDAIKFFNGFEIKTADGSKQGK